jgi:uncharacterized membrane protein/thiol-disulfide isomerase/thioredoxin
MKEAMLYEKLTDSRVRCNLCAHRYVIAEGENSVGQVREKRRGTLYTLALIVFIVLCLMVPSTAIAKPVDVDELRSDDQPVVRAILFYSPTCPHCHYVITEVLVPMVNEHGDQLQVVAIDTSQLGGAQLYQAAIERYEIAPERLGVPTLVVGDVVLVGGLEIPEQFPALFEEGLAAGGVDWPDIPGLAGLVSEAEARPSPTPTSVTTAIPVATSAIVPTAIATPVLSPTIVPRVTSMPPTSATDTAEPSVLTVGDDEISIAEVKEPPSDPVGFALAGVVLVGMIGAFGYAAWRVTIVRQRLFNFASNPGIRSKTWLIPLLAVLGLGVAAYLAYVEVNQVEAVCGPVGECNIVQTSAYAVMLGIPVAVWGVLHYVASGVLWTGQRFLSGRWANLSVLGLLGLTLFGTLFSIYLTCLELVVIHAICVWCLSSAVITTLLMLMVVVPVTSGLCPENGWRKS